MIIANALKKDNERLYDMTVYTRIYSRRYLMKIELLFTSFKDDEKDFLKTLNEYAN